MSATVLVLASFAVVAAPLLFYALTGRAGSIIAPLYIVLGGAVLVNLMIASSPPPDVSALVLGSSSAAAKEDGPPSKDGAPTSECSKLVAALEAANVIVDMSRPPQVTVNGTLWQQIPGAQREAVVACIAEVAPEGSAKPVITER